VWCNPFRQGIEENVRSLRHENGGRKWRIFLCVLVFVCLVFAGAARSSAQDLGALARREQERKEALPNHPAHVYTNDDLERPKILVPEDSAQFQSARKELPSAVALQQPASAPVTQSPAAEPAAEPEAREISLGEVAKKYREEKLARRGPLPQAAPVAVSTYVYTNDDMARPKILTPEDHAKFEAALARPVPVETKVETEPAPNIESAAPETLVSQAPRPEVPRGDVARTVYRQEHPQEPVFVARRTGGSRFPLARLAAYRTNRLPHSPAGFPAAFASVHEKRLADLQSMKPNAPGFLSITVRSGDSLWKLARRHLGHGNQWRKLLEANPWIGNPNRLRIGTQIRI
jgi:nucleoid-associated protein YgaU